MDFDDALRKCDEEIARLSAEADRFESDPRKALHFQRIALAAARGNECTEDELREAAEDDYLWSVEEKENWALLHKTRKLRQMLIDARDRMRDAAEEG